jgi:hypothetical protein
VREAGQRSLTDIVQVSDMRRRGKPTETESRLTVARMTDYGFFGEMIKKKKNQKNLSVQSNQCRTP